MALEASANMAIRTCSAIVSSSSSQSSSVSWQPSQEANFHTANVVGLIYSSFTRSSGPAMS